MDLFQLPLSPLATPVAAPAAIPATTPVASSVAPPVVGPIAAPQQIPVSSKTPTKNRFCELHLVLHWRSRSNRRIQRLHAHQDDSHPLLGPVIPSARHNEENE